MDSRFPHAAFPRRYGTLRLLAPAGCALALLGAAQARADVQQTGGSQTPTSGPGPAAPSGVSATLEQCQTALAQTERSVTFAGEMAGIPGTARMQMRIDVEERLPDDTRFHTVHAPGLGVWRSSAPAVKSYKYLKQVTNLSAPAYYRAAVRFRWLNADERLIKALERRTPVCYQPAALAGEGAPESPQATTTSPTTTGSPASTTSGSPTSTTTGSSGSPVVAAG
jgi:hypothetical protein